MANECFLCFLVYEHRSDCFAVSCVWWRVLDGSLVYAPHLAWVLVGWVLVERGFVFQ